MKWTSIGWSPKWYVPCNAPRLRRGPDQATQIGHLRFSAGIDATLVAKAHTLITAQVREESSASASFEGKSKANQLSESLQEDFEQEYGPRTTDVMGQWWSLMPRKGHGTVSKAVYMQFVTTIMQLLEFDGDESGRDREMVLQEQWDHTVGEDSWKMKKEHFMSMTGETLQWAIGDDDLDQYMHESVRIISPFPLVTNWEVKFCGQSFKGETLHVKICLAPPPLKDFWSLFAPVPPVCHFFCFRF